MVMVPFSGRRRPERGDRLFDALLQRRRVGRRDVRQRRPLLRAFRRTPGKLIKNLISLPFQVVILYLVMKTCIQLKPKVNR